jgi:hypothetical protein
MRQKIALSTPNSDTWGVPRPSNIKRYFGPLIDFLLAPDPVLDGEVNGRQATYIPNADMERELSEMLDHNQSQYWQLVGYKGVGKSSVVRGSFGLWNSEGTTRIKGNTLLIYGSFNSIYLDETTGGGGKSTNLQSVVEGLLGAGLHALRAEHVNRGGAAASKYDFHRFVLATKPNILYQYECHDADGPDQVSRELRGWERGNRLTYRAVQLKYEMSLLPESTAKGIDTADERFDKRQIVIIFDDLEGLTAANRRALVNLLGPVWSCIRNGVSYPAKILIVHRPHTRDEFVRNGVWPATTIEFRTDLTLGQLIRHRADQFVKHTKAGRDAAVRASWDRSYVALWRLLTRFGDPHQEIILALSNNCFRDSMFRLTHLMQHAAGQGQLAETSGGAFVFSHDKSLPNLDQPKLIEIIGKRGRDWFTPEPHLGLVNILLNDENDSETDLMLPLLLHWMWMHQKRKGAGWPRVVDLDILQKLLAKSFPATQFLAKLPWAVEKCKANGLMEDVLDEFDHSKILFHFMPRANLHYVELGEGSALLELFLQDFYMNETRMSNVTAGRPAPFTQALRFATTICEIECELANICVDKRCMWDSVLYQTSLSSHLLSGLQKTRARWRGEKAREDDDLLRKLAANVFALKALYEK